MTRTLADRPPELDGVGVGVVGVVSTGRVVAAEVGGSDEPDRTTVCGGG